MIVTQFGAGFIFPFVLICSKCSSKTLSPWATITSPPTQWYSWVSRKEEEERNRIERRPGIEVN